MSGMLEDLQDTMLEHEDKLDRLDERINALEKRQRQDPRLPTEDHPSDCCCVCGKKGNFHPWYVVCGEPETGQMTGKSKSIRLCNSCIRDIPAGPRISGVFRQMIVNRLKVLALQGVKKCQPED